jgi:predicted RNA-binding protein with PUA-like domain
MKYWLFKTEPDCYSIDSLAGEKKKTGHWDGVRNYQARNFLRDEIKKGDRVLVYHSSCDPPGVAGTAVVATDGYPDFTAFDPNHEHYDPKSRHEEPRWFMVDITLDQKFTELIPLTDLRGEKVLKEMEVLRKGSRLSVQPVRKKEFDHILKMAARQQA